MSHGAPGTERGLWPRSRPFLRAVQPRPTRAGLATGRFLTQTLSPHSRGPSWGLTVPAAPGPRPGGSGGGHAPSLRPGERRAAHRGPSSASFAASVETGRLPKEKEGSSPTAQLPGKSGLLLSPRSKAVAAASSGSARAPRRGREGLRAGGRRCLASAGAEPGPALGSCGRAGGGQSVTQGGKEGSPSLPGGRTVLCGRFLSIWFPCGAPVPGKRLRWPLHLCPSAPAAIRSHRFAGAVELGLAPCAAAPHKNPLPAGPACCCGPEPLAALGAV